MEIIKRHHIQIEMTEYEFAVIRDIVREAYYNAKDGDPISIPPHVIEQLRSSLDRAADSSSFESTYNENQRIKQNIINDNYERMRTTFRNITGKEC
jgi:hypothetical protein